MVLESAENDLMDYNLIPETLPKHLPKKVWIWDETLRDGEQTPGTFLTVEEKVELSKLLDEIGVRVIVPSFPAVSKSEKKVIRALSRENLTNAKIAATARPKRADIDACLACDVEEIPIFMSTSRILLKYSIRKNVEEAMEMLVDAVTYARDHGVVVDFVAEDATRSYFDELIKICEAAVRAGTDKIALADTLGVMRPTSMKYLVGKVRDELNTRFNREIPLSVHCHNDFGLATANTLAGVEEGVIYPHTCVNGYGERGGNASFEEVVLSLELLYKVDTGIKLDRIYEVSQEFERVFGIPLSVHKPLVGDNSFRHESGIHVYALLRNKHTYEPFPPELIGRNTELFLGKHTGKHAVRHLLEEEGIVASDDQVEKIVNEIKKRQERQNKEILRARFMDAKEKMRTLHRGMFRSEFLEIVRRVTKKTT
ncbi:MAG: homocitrate synthase/isopropylmalate synthase family protein [Candidatus Jordarchaeum sp.]|uniref:homocitrate synthase/isopropylmalate synthase family protein n=1 Tax=Candidatus Jordarchaeum sp. TaxID=2823881 RepID=UPI00404A1FFF